MAQTSNITFPLKFLSAKNLAYATTNSATSVIDALNVGGFFQFGITVSNSGTSANVVGNVDIYGSEDNITYILITSNVMAGTIPVGSAQHYEFKLLMRYLRIKITSAGTSTVDVFVNAN